MNTTLIPSADWTRTREDLLAAAREGASDWIDEDEMRDVLTEALRKGISPRTILACREACHTREQFTHRVSSLLRRGLKRVLVVDTDEVTRRHISRFLAESGLYQVRAEIGAREAIEAASEYQPDLLIVDLRLPKTGGPRLAEMVRRIGGRARMPVILLTDLLQSTGYSIVNSHGTLHMAKPVKLKSLLHCVEGLLDSAIILPREWN